MSTDTKKVPQTTQVQEEPIFIKTPVMTTNEKFGNETKTVLDLTEIHFSVEIIPQAHSYKQRTKMTFQNFTKKTLEGELLFPIPKGATLCGYALDIDGQMIEATLIEDKKATEVFEAEVQNRQEVAVAKYVCGNQFKTKVYPIHADKTRTIQVDFLTDLERKGDEKEQNSFVEIPLEVSKYPHLKKLSLKVNLAGSDVKPIINKEIKKSFTEKDNVMHLDLDLSDVISLESLTVQIPSKTEESVYLENNQEHSQHYFNVSSFVKVKSVESKDTKEKNIAILWDASISRDKHSTDLEFKLIQDFLSKGSYKVDLYTFSNDFTKVGTFTSSKDILEALKNVLYDGGTNLNLIKQILEKEKYDFSLLFSDGFDNLSNPKDGPFKLKKKVPIYTFNTSVNANMTYLQVISEVTGGSSHYLKKYSNFDQIISEIGLSPFGFISYDFNPNEISDLTPSNPCQLENGNQFTCSGVLLSDKATIKINFGRGDDVTETKTITLDKKKSVNSNLIGILWGQRMIQELSIFPDFNAEQLLSIGRKFSLVSPNTSLIVLENLDQYTKHKITPPKSRTQIYKDYQDFIQKQEKNENDRVKNKTKDVLRKFDEIKQWYKNDYIGSWKSVITNETSSKNKENQIQRKKADEIKVFLNEFEEKLKREIQAENERLEKLKVENEKKIASKKEEAKKKEEARNKELEDLKNKKKLREESKKVLKKIKTYTEKKPIEKKLVLNEKEISYDKKSEESFSMMKGDYKDKEMKKKSKKMESLSQDDVLESISRSRGLNCDQTDFLSEESRSRSRESDDLKESNEGGSIKLKSWSPDVPYINELKNQTKDNLYSTYFKLRPQNKASPAFYLDVADYFFKQDLKVECLKILTNILELDLESAQLTRIIGYKLEEFNSLDLADQMFRKVLKLNPHEPQSYRDLALVLGKKKNYKEAIQLLYKVVTGQWSGSFDEVELTALVEMNRMIVFNDNKDIPKDMDQGFVFPMKIDLRVVMAWDTNQTDIDLHTKEPTGEQVNFSHRRSTYGGFNSRDFTQGYGPETYMIKNAVPGKYVIMAKYYASHQQSLTGGTTILLTLFTNYGDKEKEESQQITIRLSTNKEIFEVGEIEIKPNQEIKRIQAENEEAKENLKKTEEEVKGLQVKKDTCETTRQREIEKVAVLIRQETNQFNTEFNKLEKEIKDKDNELLRLKKEDEEEQKIFEYEYDSKEKKGTFSSFGNTDFDIKL